ncbi:MAG TPA: ribbon-helix-helix protein, CopG family [Streptosporangiaceae bacterium]|jgi:predicted DNA-binding protein|nr:ribbon-helix-helix protein, CopG family [Streptosporangiaceae bacterium]
MPMKPGSTKNLLLRLDPDLAERLQTVADVEGRSVSDVVREAITALVEQRRADQRFLRLLEDNLDRHRQALTLLRDDPP